jgi:hypothetical protein
MLVEIIWRKTALHRGNENPRFQAFFFVPPKSDRLFGFFKHPKTAVSITTVSRGMK